MFVLKLESYLFITLALLIYVFLFDLYFGFGSKKAQSLPTWCVYFLHLHHNGPYDITRIIYHIWINLLCCSYIVVFIFCPTFSNDHGINIIIVSVSESFWKVSEMLFYDYYHSCRRSPFSPSLHTQLNHLYYSSSYITS